MPSVKGPGASRMERLPAPAFLPADSRIYGTFLPGCSEQAGRWAGGEPPTQDLRARARAGRGPGQGEGKEGRVHPRGGAGRGGGSRLPHPLSPRIRGPKTCFRSSDGRVQGVYTPVTKSRTFRGGRSSEPHFTDEGRCGQSGEVVDPSGKRGSHPGWLFCAHCNECSVWA